MSDVVVVGSFNLDHVWVSDALPVPGATRLGRYLSGPGGKGFNQAIAAARAGARTTFITALGEDAAATLARALAAADALELHADVRAELPSGTAGIFVDAEGRNSIVVAPGANDALDAAFVERQLPVIAHARVLLAQLEVASAAVLAALKCARANGVLTVLNPAPANARTTLELLAHADVLTPNETEFAALAARHHGITLDADSLADEADERLHALCRCVTAGTLVITLGARGAFVSHGEQSHGDSRAFYRIAAEAVTAIDTTGAGDAFNGAFCAAVANAPTAAFEAAVRFANRYAALSTERRGAALAMPQGDEVCQRFGD